ncbi:hypothetical protein [Lacinutrix sp. MEBiC02404]
MSDKLPDTNNSEEIDLGQLFSFIERVFKRIGNFIYKIFSAIVWVLEKIGILILVIISILKKHFLKVLGGCILVYVSFYLLDKYSSKKYQSTIVITQNFQTGNLLYNTISRLNTLAKEKDSVGLSNELGVSLEKASKIVELGVKDYMSKTEFIEAFNEYNAEKDSTAMVTQEAFNDIQDLENFETQIIFVYSKDPTIYSGMSDAFLKLIESNKYFIEEQQKVTTKIKLEIKTYKDNLVKSEDLQKDYVSILKSYYSATDGETSQANVSLNLSNNKEKINTKEFELLGKQNEARLNIIDLENQLIEKETIVRLQKDFTRAITVDSFYRKNGKTATMLIAILIVLFYLVKEFKLISFIDYYGKKENLTDKLV